MPAVLFDIRDLTKIYGMGEVEVHALRQINLQVHEGHFVVLLGPSGSGKSTLLNVIGGVDVPTSGRVLYRDIDLTRADKRRSPTTAGVTSASSSSSTTSFRA